MSYQTSTIIDKEICTGCGKCIDICPYEILEMTDGKATVRQEPCMHCAQCVAICPADAVTVDDMPNLTPKCAGEIPAADTLFRVMQSRRSYRAYQDTPLTEQQLNDLVTFGLWAPSGTNSQEWTFTVVPDRTSMLAFAEATAGFYRDLNRKARNPFLRLFTRVFMKDVLGKYYRRYYEEVELAMKEYYENGRDLLFHGATAAIVVATTPDASCPSDDAHMAAQNILLGAETMGLGSCCIGFAVEAMMRDKRITRLLGIPDRETVYSVIALGNPKYNYVRPSGRRPVKPRIFQI